MGSPSTSNVRFFTVSNVSYIHAENVEVLFDTLLIIELGILIINLIMSIYFYYLFIFIRAMHFNLNFLYMSYACQYFFSMLSRCLIIYQQLGMDPNDNLKSVIYYANYIRTISLFIAMYILLVFMVERCVATFLVKNYEKSRKPWVSLVILSIFYPLVFASAISYIQCRLPVIFHVFSIFIANIIGSIGIHLCFSYNTKRYKMFYTHQEFAKVHYGLSERFQLAENIKMCKILKKVKISIMFFNIGSSLIFMMDHFEVQLMIRYWVYTMLNYFILAYGMTGAVTLFIEIPAWKKETRRLLNLYFHKNSVENQPKTTFGEQMIYNDPGQETKIYFNDFDRSTK